MLPDKPLAHVPRFERVVKAQPSDMAVCADALDSREVAHFGVSQRDVLRWMGRVGGMEERVGFRSEVGLLTYVRIALISVFTLGGMRVGVSR